ncbi:MAG: TolC family protein [Candidatus Aminicenantaceae bacterium]
MGKPVNKLLTYALPAVVICLCFFNPEFGWVQESDPDADSNLNSLTLEQCIDIALENNPVLGYQNWEIEALEALKKEAAGQRLPRISGSGNYHHYSDTMRLAPPRGFSYPLIFTDDILSFNVALAMPVFTGGRISNQIQAAELFQQSAEHSLVHTREELIFKVTSVYYSMIKQHQILKSLDFSKTTLEKHLKRVKEMLEAKKAAELDQLRMEVRLADIVQRIEKEKNTLAVKNRTLANLMGVEEIDFRIPPEEELPFNARELDLEKSISTAYANRTDYQSVQKEAEAQEKKIKAAHAGFWPSVSLYASYGVQAALGNYIRQVEVDRIEDIGQIGLSFELPFYEGGRKRAAIHLEQARLAMLNEKLRELELRIRLDVEAAVLNIKYTSKRISATHKALEQARATLRIELEKYDLGMGSITDIFDAESALLELQTVYYSALADYHIYCAHLTFVQGRS